MVKVWTYLEAHCSDTLMSYYLLEVMFLKWCLFSVLKLDSPSGYSVTGGREKS